MFADPWNPSSTEIRAWAYSDAPEEPCQDWDLALSWVGHERDYLELAADPACPTREFFLHILYLMIGDAVRSEFKLRPEQIVRGFIELAADSTSPEVRLWRERSLRLLKHPEEFSYDDWCGGGLVRSDCG
jgi:hypothetical protein